jgi:hypothetical protein
VETVEGLEVMLPLDVFDAEEHELTRIYGCDVQVGHSSQ